MIKHAVTQLWRRRVLGLVFAVFLVSGYAGTSILRLGDAQAVSCGGSGQQSRFSGQYSTPAAYGVDGYMQYGTGSLSDPSCNKIVMGLFVNTTFVDSGTLKQGFVQVGTRIGYQDSTTVDTSEKVFVEVDGVPQPNADPCLTYSRITYGAPTAVDSPYYLYWTGSSTNVFCVTMYSFGVKRDSWANAPFAVGLLRVASPQWSAQTELGSLKASPPWEWLGTTYHGWPTNLGNGLAWFNYTPQTWNEWTTAQSMGTLSQSPLIYHGGDVFGSNRAFHTTK